MELARSVIALVALSGCADAGDRFGEFEERRRALEDGRGVVGAGGESSCSPPAPDSVRGTALLALETSTAPGVAILFLGELETPEVDGTTAVKFSYRALDASDRRTKVGDSLVVGPYPIAEDGSFDAPTPRATLPGSANAILPGLPITSQLTLHGSICGVAAFYCGTVTGTVTAPVDGPATGRFGLTLLDREEQVPARPRFGCDEDALAPPLAP